MLYVGWRKEIKTQEEVCSSESLWPPDLWRIFNSRMGKASLGNRMGNSQVCSTEDGLCVVWIERSKWTNLFFPLFWLALRTGVETALFHCRFSRNLLQSHPSCLKRKEKRMEKRKKKSQFSSLYSGKYIAQVTFCQMWRALFSSFLSI